MILTQDRARGYAYCALAVNTLVLAITLLGNHSGNTIFGAPFGGDFVAFYAAGRVVSDYGSSRLYDLDLHDRLVRSELPGMARELELQYVNPPFVAVAFAPISHLSLAWAYGIWLVLSILLYVAAVLLMLRLNPSLPRKLTLLVVLAFAPFSMFLLRFGQLSAIGCFVLAAFIYCLHIKRPITAGLILSLMLYKPPLVIFIVPVLAVNRRWRALAGFAIGGVVLGLFSLWLIGITGLERYAEVLRLFLSSLGFGDARAANYVDISAFVRQLLHINMRMIPLFAALLFTWFLRGERWLAVVPLTLLANSYAPIYDVVILVPVLVLTAQRVGPKLLAILFVTSLIAVPISQAIGVQLMTPVLCLLVWRCGFVRVSDSEAASFHPALDHA